MKKYVEKEKKEYINNCYLETTGTKNNINDIIECLNNWDISEDSKEQIIKNMSEQIEDIRDINTDYYEKIIINNKIKPTWENYYYYYTNSNEITITLLKNIELNIENIKKQNVSSIKMPEEDKKEFTNFRAKIARNNELNISVYKQIIPVCWILLNTIEENEIEAERLKMLVSNKIIKINNNNLQVLYGEVPEIIDIYINDNIDTFINEIKSYTLTEEMVCDIIKSSNIKFKDKSRIIDLIDISYINEDSMEFIINNYSQNRISKIHEKLKQKIFKSQLNISCKLMFLEKELDKNSSIDLISNYLKLLPVPYKYIADYENYPKAFSIPKTEKNKNILEKLEGKNFKFTKSTKKNRIIIYNKK